MLPKWLVHDIIFFLIQKYHIYIYICFRTKGASYSLTVMVCYNVIGGLATTHVRLTHRWGPPACDDISSPPEECLTTQIRASTSRLHRRVKPARDPPTQMECKCSALSLCYPETPNARPLSANSATVPDNAVNDSQHLGVHMQ